MPSITASILPHGAIIQLAVLVSTPRRQALVARGLKPPAPVLVSGLIDYHLIQTLPVIETSLGHQGHQALIGRDILAHGILVYNGPKGEITLTF